jgi:large subunit ribosomal protein L32
MANPKKKTTRSRKGNRYSKIKMHFRNSQGELIHCGHCNRLIRAHHVCPYCGYYDGKLVVKQEQKKEKPAA